MQSISLNISGSSTEDDRLRPRGQNPPGVGRPVVGAGQRRRRARLEQGRDGLEGPAEGLADPRVPLQRGRRAPQLAVLLGCRVGRQGGQGCQMAKFFPSLHFLGWKLVVGAIQGKEGIKFCSVA